MIAHAGGIDEMVFVLVPLLVFLTLQWLNRRKAAERPDPETPKGGATDAERLERRRRLSGGLLPDSDAKPSKPDDPPEGR